MEGILIKNKQPYELTTRVLISLFVKCWRLLPVTKQGGRRKHAIKQNNSYIDFSHPLVAMLQQNTTHLEMYKSLRNSTFYDLPTIPLQMQQMFYRLDTTERISVEVFTPIKNARERKNGAASLPFQQVSAPLSGRLAEQLQDGARNADGIWAFHDLIDVNIVFQELSC